MSAEGRGPVGRAGGDSPATSGPAVTGPDLSGPADLVITGRIATLAPGSPLGWVGGLAIRGARVVLAGTPEAALRLVGGRTRVWRLPADLVVMPGITDAHLHLSSAALSAADPDLTGLSLRAVADAIAEAHRHRAAAGDRSGWITGHGWSFDALDGRPTAALLDAAAPGRPVALWAHDHHSRWLSSRAIVLAGLGEAPDPAAGRIERDGQGSPTGILFEGAAGLADAAIPERSHEELEAALATYALDLARLGITAAHDPGDVARDPDLHRGPTFYRRLARLGRLPLHVVGCVREEQLERAIETGFRTGQLEQEAAPGPIYRDGWLKLFSDGALGSRTAALLAPYEPGDPAGPPPGGPAGMALRSRGQLAEAAGRAAAAGIASQIHAIGDGAVRAVLDVLAELPTVGQARHRVEHAQLVDPQDVARFAACGIAASVQPCHLLSDAAGARRAWGSRTANAFPLAALDATGVLLPLGTDAPVEPVDPWPGLAAAVTRRGAAWPADEAFHPEQAIPLARAIRAACLDGPRSLGIVDQGHLEHGAVADLIVVPAGLFEGAPDAATIAGTRPLATLVAGHLVHEAVVLDA